MSFHRHTVCTVWLSNHVPMFLTCLRGWMSQSPTLIEAMVTLDDCCYEPRIRNSVFESLNINLCETNQALTSAMQNSTALIAWSWAANESGRNGTYGSVLSAYPRTDDGCFLTPQTALMHTIQKGQVPNSSPEEHFSLNCAAVHLQVFSFSYTISFDF